MTKEKPIYNPSMTIRFSPELIERLERVANMYGVSRGEVVRMAVGQYVGQVTGLLDQMVKNADAQAKSIDMEKMLEMMMDKMIKMDSARGSGENPHKMSETN